MGSDDAEAVRHDAAAAAGEAARAGDTLAGRTCDGEGGVTLAAEADAGIRRSIFDEYGGFDCLRKAGQVVDVLGVHMSGVTVAMLSLYG